MRIYIYMHLSIYIYYKYMRISLKNDGSLTFSEFTKPPFLSFGIIKTRNTNSECQSPQLATRLTGAPNDIETLGTNGPIWYNQRIPTTRKIDHQNKFCRILIWQAQKTSLNKNQVSKHLHSPVRNINSFPHFLITWNNNCWFFRFSNFFIIFFASVFLQKNTFPPSLVPPASSWLVVYHHSKKNDHLGLNCI